MAKCYYCGKEATGWISKRRVCNDCFLNHKQGIRKKSRRRGHPTYYKNYIK